MTRTERTYYVVVALWNIPGWFMHPVYPIFLMSRGLDLFQINLILAIFLICTFLFEVPTGAVADLYGRKISFLASCVTRMFAFVLYSFADGFVACAIAEVIDAIGLTLASGSLEAWAVDGVRAEGDVRPTDRLFARAQMIIRGSMIAGGIVCGYLADRFGLGLPWLVAASIFGVAFVVGLATMYDDRPARRVHGVASGQSLARAVVQGLVAVRQHAVMRMICLITLGSAFAAMPVVMLWPPHMQSLSGEGYWLLGWIWAGLSLSALVGASLVSVLLRRLRREQLLFGIALWRGAFLAAAALAASFEPVVGFLLIYEIAVGGWDPVMTAWMNEHVESDLRATVLSVKGMAFTLGGSIGLVCLGALARADGIATAWLVAAIVLASLAPFTLLLGSIARRHARAVARSEDRTALPS